MPRFSTACSATEWSSRSDPYKYYKRFRPNCPWTLEDESLDGLDRQEQQTHEARIQAKQEDVRVTKLNTKKTYEAREARLQTEEKTRKAH
jgi:hypothetical protein